MSYDCFLSYSSTDRALAERIHARLRSAGLSVWFDRIRLQPGFDWHREIEAACESSRVLLPILTPNWNTSEWTRYETYGAENVIPILNTVPKPFVWTKTADEILASVARFCHRISETGH